MEGWTTVKAQTELENVLVEVRLGTWMPPQPEPEEPQAPRTVRTFHEVASERLAGRRTGATASASG